MMLITAFAYFLRKDVVMEQSDWQAVVCQMKDEWRFVSPGSGKQFVTTTGVRMKQESCVDN